MILSTVFAVSVKQSTNSEKATQEQPLADHNDVIIFR